MPDTIVWILFLITIINQITSITADNDNVLSGTICGISQTGEGSFIIKCDGHDPFTSCPSGYVHFADPYFYYGLCYKNETNKQKGKAGTLCGGSPSYKCGGLDPVWNCPHGYIKPQYPSSGRSCVKYFSDVNDVAGTICGWKGSGNLAVKCGGYEIGTCPPGYQLNSVTLSCFKE
ncbi:unnamed protein product [Rotaria sp. Silwood1]|nr:unnamed protein product [Rotaria sp. Silwood1]